MNIFNITTKTLILDYCINILFDKISKNFSTFDLFDGCREFKVIRVYNIMGLYYTIATNATIEMLEFRKDKFHRMVVVGLDILKCDRRRTTFFRTVKTCIPGELLEVVQ